MEKIQIKMTVLFNGTALLSCLFTTLFILFGETIFGLDLTKTVSLNFNFEYLYKINF